MTEQYFSGASLQSFVENVFLTFEVPRHDARQAAEILITSDLRGIDSHGVARLRPYVELLRAGEINPKPNVRVERQRAATATIDGDNGLGLVVAPRANELAMEKAEKTGAGWVAVNHTNHFGIAGYYPLQAVGRELMGWAMTNTGKWMAPTFGAERMLGTNPIAVGFPAGEMPPVIIDMATSAVSFGKVQIKRRAGQPLPDGWILDKDGRASNDPEALIGGGMLLPLGSQLETGSHKGYCLAALVDICTAVLSGANWGPFAPPFASRTFTPEASVGRGIGHFFGALDIEGFMDVGEFKRRMDAWIQRFQQTHRADPDQAIWVPGQPETIAQMQRLETGVPISEAVWRDLNWVSEQTSVSLPE